MPTIRVSSAIAGEVSNAKADVGVVVIGRNEGLRLQKCLASVRVANCIVVYVDSGSTDNSVAHAKSAGIDVVSLDMSVPFTAARARNAGFDRLLQLNPGIKFVQFVDGDCELHSDWLRIASHFLLTHPDIAVVAGRLHERYPDASVYNMLCDMEWDVPVGEATICGGLAMMRVNAVAAVKGFKVTLICGEEPELCSRLRARGGKVWRLADSMAWHDANMLHFRQWWLRAKRSGYSDAQATVVDRILPERRGVRASLSTWFWAAALPAAIVIATTFSIQVAGLICLVYPLQILRLAIRGPYRVHQNFLRAVFLVMGKFPELQGQIKYRIERQIGRQSALIEHK